jgi:hypothetical protein
MMPRQHVNKTAQHDATTACQKDRVQHNATTACQQDRVQHDATTACQQDSTSVSKAGVDTVN